MIWQVLAEDNARLSIAVMDLSSALRGMLDAYAPYADATAEREGEEALHSAVRNARAVIRKVGGTP